MPAHRRTTWAARALAASAAVAVLAACAQRARGLPDELAEARRDEAAAATTSTAAPTTTTAAPTTTTAPPVDVWALRPPEAAGDPVALAAQITDAERVLRDPGASPEAVGRAALAQQVAYRRLGDLPDWDAAVLAAVPADLHGSVTHHVAARRAFRSMHRRLATTLPAWQIVPPAPLEQLEAFYREAELAFGVPWRYLAAINLVETGMGRIRGTSSAGAQGPMQFMPATWAAYGAGGDINNVRDAILGAGRYLAANGGGADIDNALWNYNHSDAYVYGVKLYADLIGEHPYGLRALYHWGVFYLTAAGEVFLPVGYEQATPVPVA